MQFVCIFPHLLHICRKFDFLISQGSVATFLRWDGYCHVDFVANFIRFSAVRKFWKLGLIFDKVTESLKVGTFFETRCILNSVFNLLPTVWRYALWWQSWMRPWWVSLHFWEGRLSHFLSYQSNSLKSTFKSLSPNSGHGFTLMRLY